MNHHIVPTSRTGYNSLLHFDDARDLVKGTEEARELIKEALKKSGLSDKFGICLLHKHFDIGADEIVIRENFGATEIKITPRKLIGIPSLIEPHTWRFSGADGSGGLATEVVEFSGENVCIDIAETDIELITIIGQKIIEWKVNSIYGLSRIPRLLKVKEPTQVLVEREVNGDTSLIISLMEKREKDRLPSTTQTLWTCSSNDNSGVHCWTHCSNHCHHCTHCGSHG